MRILLFTGKGGVGKSTLAAATACASAAAGHRTLVLSTDAAHSLADALDVPATAEPTEAAPHLWVQHVDAQQRFEHSWADIQGYLMSVLDVAGVDPVAAEELTVIPGAEEVLALLEVRAQARSGEWDVLVVDCAPTAETLRLLALPEALGWYMTRVLPVERRVVKALKPVLTRAAGVPMPEDSVFDAIERLHADLDDVRKVLTGPDTSVRLVLTPESVVLAEARRAYTFLTLFGYAVDGAVVNRVFPEGGTDAWRTTWVRAQGAVLEEAADSFAGLDLRTSVYRSAEPVGREALLDLAADVYGTSDPLARGSGGVGMTVRATNGARVLSMPLPLAAQDDVRLARKGDELVVSVASYRRLLTLPSGLARHRVAGARVHDGELQVRFVEPSSTTSDAPETSEETL
ncbi:arsenic-transporting ATPase [Nocardioides flavus (ex Wang et al. 2016)]|uniref:Arsenic-transporting ATPase n=1 Tax=Nocardioides flavus (ex Wang et al. 2016) TaxID=2058780 RepID=A0ABQ3HMC0_9ACTN|nr:ArsA family ATPase [Nocardioides flavus (ex Wang et al. 2016)]GHE17269.1 arsenic-transporting ATPase [Nocardioides flavus (ex Wang et al. 2016)]